MWSYFLLLLPLINPLPVDPVEDDGQPDGDEDGEHDQHRMVQRYPTSRLFISLLHITVLKVNMSPMIRSDYVTGDLPLLPLGHVHLHKALRRRHLLYVVL